MGDSDSLPDEVSDLVAPLTPELEFHHVGDLQGIQPATRAWRTHLHKCYERLPHIDIPHQAALRTETLHHVASIRHSSRDFGGPPTGDQIGSVAWLALREEARTGRAADLARGRTYPSAGARYPVEGYLVAMRSVASINAGTYHFCSARNQLELIAPKADDDAVARVFAPEFSLSGVYLLILTAVLGRVTSKYGPRGYRYALIEAGHVGQTVCLAAAALGLSCCPLGAFLDDELSALLHLRPQLEMPLYAIALGVPAGDA